MPLPPRNEPFKPASRAEKLSILSAMLGPDAMARVRDARPNTPPGATPEQVEVDADRAAWHRNKLLERLRQQEGKKTATSAPGVTAKAPAPASNHASTQSMNAELGRLTGVPKAHLDARLLKITDFENLGLEHPAVIARVIRTLGRDERVEALKSLPGPIARSVVRRLR